MRVGVDAQLAADLDAGIPSRAKRFVDRRIGLLTWDGTLSIGGAEIDRLKDARGVREVLQAAQFAGCPLTYAVRLIREPEPPLRVAVDPPMSGAF